MAADAEREFEVYERRRDALHHAWAERDRLRVQVAELKAGRVVPDYSVPGDHHDNVCERRSGHEWPFCYCKVRAEVHEEPDDTSADRGPLTPHPPPWPVDEP